MEAAQLYHEHWSAAERLRRRHQPGEAIKHYKDALRISSMEGSGQHDADIQQQLGVCYGLLRDYEEEERWLTQSLQGASGYDRARRLRDLGRSYARQGRTEHAMAMWQESLAIFGATQDTDVQYCYARGQMASTLHFMGRAAVKQGDLLTALRRYAEAEGEYARADNLEEELYFRLDYAHALSAARRPLAARQQAWRALQLTRRFGGRPHRGRAVALLTGGVRLETWAKQRYGR
jgi:tetratricopeptide (TPR) repeat protein